MHSVRRITDSVRVRVTLLATFLVAVVLVVGALLLTRAVEDRLVSDREHAAAQAVGATVQQVEQGVPFGAITHQTFDQQAGVGIFDSAGVAVAGQPSLPIKSITLLPGVDGSASVLSSSPTSQMIFINEPDSLDVAYDAAPVAVGGGNFFVVGMASLGEVRHSVRTLWSGLRLGIPLVVLVVALVAWLLAGRALRPVEAMRLEVENISATTLQRRVREPRSHDEVARLARTMNSMLGRLQTSRDHERQFLSDASHELRSPLASMRAQLETGTWPSDADGVKAEAARLSHIVDDLMDLAKADEAAPPTTETDLDEVVVEEVSAISPTTDIAIDTTNVSAARLIGDRQALARLVRNLVDNASRHATSRVDVSLTNVDGVVTLTVDDDGEGVAEDDRERIFERFTRTDSSRSRDTGGVGLGLAVVRATAQRHGGDVHCETAPNGGARFVVTLPGDAESSSASSV
ncbi:MAG TPA: HAMP domain-containing sensor histidine kinase [Ilumatobacteraceae bacterium]|nr:HAMP domain-containing sensor histidine kinase [Ilumatobacteraceae bacterium]